MGGLRAACSLHFSHHFRSEGSCRSVWPPWKGVEVNHLVCRRDRFLVARLSAALAWAILPWASAADVQPNESLVTSQPDIIDLEFSHTRSQFVWTDAIGRLWVGNINPQTGLFEPTNGKGMLVDREALSIVKTMTIPINGPEWITTAKGDQIVYTKFLPNAAQTKENARVAYAEQGDDGAWTVQFLAPDGPRNGPYASHDAADTRPRISYANELGHRYWREIYDAATEEAIPLAQQGQRSVRFVEGQRALIYAAPINGVNQILYYDLDTKSIEQLTFDAKDKDLKSVPWMWRAPEFGGEYVFFTVVDYRELRVYRRLPADGGVLQWTPIYTTQLPLWLKIMSPEPFVYNGTSYIYFVTATAPDTYASQVWLSNIDASAPFTRKVSADTLYRQRSDPEVFFCADGAYLYYNRADQSTLPAKQEGVFRAFTGLTPQN